jgi:hypothetical protein
LDIVTSFTDDNLASASARKVGLSAIPVEAFWTIPKNAFAEFGEFDFSERLNFTALTTGAYTDAYIELEASGFTFDWSGTGNITYTSTSEPIGYAKWVGNNDFTDYEDFSGDLYLDTSSPWDFLDTLPDNVEFIAKNVARMGDGSALHMITYKPGAAYAGFRPMTDDTYDGYTFIDNLGFNGEVYFSAYITFDPAVGTPASGTNNQFIGFIKRSAMGKTAGDLLDSDIVCGLISQGTSGRLVVNGSVVESWTHSFERGNREFALSFYPQFDLSEATAAQLNELPMTFDGAYMQGYDAAGDSDPYVDYSGDFTVDMSEAVIAAINDADLEGIGGSWTGYDHGSFESTCFLETVYYGEMAKGYVYVSGEAFGDVDQALDVSILPPFGDVVQSLDVSILPPFGDVVQSLDVSFVTPWTHWGDRVIQPLTVRFTSSGDVVQALDVSFDAPHGDVVQPLSPRFIGFGDVVQPLTVALRDPTVPTKAWKVRAMVGGVDISERTKGEGSVRAEEGGARIASLVLAPEVGPIDAEEMSGQPIIIDFLMKEGGNWTSRRLFTGKVDEPVWDVSRGTLSLSCTDDLQNRVAALSRDAIDAITGGRFHLSVQGEQGNNWEYAQAVMESVMGSLDADAFGALRVTPWHTDFVWNTYTPANTERDSIYFTLPARTGIINQIVGTFEYRFTRLHRRTASMNYLGDMKKTVHYGLPLLARATVEAALEGTGWNFYYGEGAIGPGGSGGETPWGVTDGQPVTPSIEYKPYPEQYDMPGGGIWYQKEPDTTCLGFSCSMWRRWAQTITEKYVMTVKAPESIAANGVRARQDHASLESKWDASSWESDPAAQPAPPLGGRHATLDYSPDATPSDRDAAIATYLDTLKVEIDSTHRDGRGGATTWLTPELDLDKRVRIEKGENEGEGKVISVEHRWSQENGRAVTDFEIAITRHGAVGIMPPDDTPSEAPEAPAVPEISVSIWGSLYDAPELHIGAIADAPEEDENWTGWIVNVPASYNVDDPGSSEPSINPETQKTERRLVNNPYRGGTANPLYRADKAYTKTGFRVKLPAVEDEMRDAAEPAVKTTYTIAIPQDDFNLSA